MKLRRYAVVLIALIFFIQIYPAMASSESSEDNSSVSFDQIWESMGGSLSTQPLSHAIYCYWTGEDEASAARIIYHDRSDSPYQDLSIIASRPKVQSGDDVFLYLAPEPYDVEVTRSKLEETYEFVPIARDALVFLTNALNPVRDVSSQDIAKVYEGQIVNWSELGGKNATIKAFQRSASIYSQLMLENTIMLDKSMAEPIVHWMQAEEGGQEYFETNSAYDNSEFALGYTMYYYANGMYGSEETNILAIDSVVPNQQTITAGLYPFITTYYAIFPKNTPEDHPVRALVSWLCTDEGQQVIQNAGYIPLRELDAEPQARQAPYPAEDTRQSCGTGGTQDRNNEPRVYSKECLRGIGSMDYVWVGFAWEEVLIDLPDSPAMMETIAAWRRNAREDLMSAAIDDEQAVDEYVFIYGNLISFFESVRQGTDTVIRTAVFDLKTEIQLQLSDLFLDGFNYIQYINRFLLESSMQEGSGALGDFSVEEQNLNGPFSGLPAEYPYFFVSQEGKLCLAYPGDNPLIQVPYDNAFFSAIPLWHDISPWGGCNIEQSFHVINNQDPKAFFYQPSLVIDGGQHSEAGQAIQEMEQASVETFTEIVVKQGKPYDPDDPIICLPAQVVYGRWYSLCFYAYEPETVGYSPMMGGIVIDLHTGEEMLTDKQAKGLTLIPGAVILKKDSDAPAWEDMQPVADYKPSDQAVVRGVWLDSYLKDDVTHVNVEIAETDGSYVRITVPVEAIGF